MLVANTQVTASESVHFAHWRSTSDEAARQKAIQFQGDAATRIFMSRECRCQSVLPHVFYALPTAPF